MQVKSTYLFVLLLLTGLLPASAEERQVRIAQQFGLSYLPLHVAIEQKLIEKHAKSLGLGDVTVEVSRIASGASANDALISGSVDVAMAGATVLANLWDKTVGRDAIKGICAIADSPIYFNTIDPKINSIRDFTNSDRIAMTAGSGTQHSLVLQMATAQAFGWDQRNRFDHLAISMSHPDGVVALLSGGATLKTHATTVPYIQMELADSRVRTILKSDDVVGGPHTLIVAYTRESWATKNPRLAEATFKAFSEAIRYISANKREAAELYVRVEKPKMSPDEIYDLLKDEKMIAFREAPSRLTPFLDHMVRTGLLKNRPSSWKDLFLPTVHHLTGS